MSRDARTDICRSFRNNPFICGFDDFIVSVRSHVKEWLSITRNTDPLAFLYKANQFVKPFFGFADRNGKHELCYQMGE